MTSAFGPSPRVLLVALLGVAVSACEEEGGSHGARVSAVTAAPARASTSPQPSSPSRQTASHPGAQPRPSGPAFEGTAGVVERGPRAPGIARLDAVRAARHDGFDRVVFDFAEGALPGYHIEYIDKPVRKCGSSEPTPILGDGWLEVRLAPATARGDAGRVATATEQSPKLPTLLELERTCDSDATVTWVLGTASPNPFRVLELAAPTRLVVDIRHDEPRPGAAH